MELKRASLTRRTEKTSLLIVPYGIETYGAFVIYIATILF